MGFHFSRLNRAAMAAFFVSALVLASQPVSAIRVLSYNLLLYPGTSAAQRDPAFREVIAGIQPDVLMACEMADATGANAFLANVLNQVNPGEWALHSYFTAGDRDQVCFYRTTKLERFGIGTPDDAKTIGTSPRLTPRWRLRPVGYSHSSNLFYIYGCHLKASDQPEDVADRAAASDLIRADANAFLPNTRFIICGDMNFYTAAEAGYHNFLDSEADNDGRTVDILNPSLASQNWHGQFNFRFMHSQSPRTTNPPGQGAGVLGGLDDRFDFLFVSTILNGTSGISYIPGTYHTYGQDGNHFNLAVNNPLPNGDVSDSIANALWMASDHLPIFLDLNAPARISVSSNTLDFGTVIVGAAATQPLTVTDTAPIPGETLTYQYFSIGLMNFTAPAGLHSEPAGGGSNNDTITMSTAVAGVKNQSPAINMTTNARESQIVPINATGTVLRHAVPSTDAGMVDPSGVGDFGAHAPGSFSDINVAVFNVGFDGLQALLDVYDYAITGVDAARFSVVSFVPSTVGGQAAVYTVHFDDSGAGACNSFHATLTFHTRDQQDLPGATNLGDVTYDLVATPSTFVPLRGDIDASGFVDCGDVQPFVSILLDPNFGTPTQRETADMSGDCTVNGMDIQLFEEVLSCP